jgi:radical SAM superfamily enzyme YgiQ (UPF0313 family)
MKSNNLKVAFCLPYYAGRNHSPFLGIGYLSSILNSNGIETRIFDLDAIAWVMLKKHNDNHMAETNSFLADRLAKFEPDIIAVTINTTNYEETINLLKHIHNYKGKAKIIVGGPHISTSYSAFNKYHYNLFDLAIIGEGETALLEICKNMIANTWNNCYNKNDYVLGSPVENLDSFPYPDRNGFYTAFNSEDFKLVEEHYRRNFYTHLPGFKGKKYERVVASRGCDYQCSFCSPGILWRDYKTNKPKRRIRSPKNIVDEIEMLYEKGITAFYFDDPTFPVCSDLGFFTQFVFELKNRGLSIKWAAPVRVEEIDNKIVDVLRESGFSYTYFGLETYNEKQLSKFNKELDIEKSLDIINILKNNDIHCDVSYQIGLPNEELSEIYKGIDWLANNNLQKNTFFSITAIWPETQLAKQHNISSEDYEPTLNKSNKRREGLHFFRMGNKEIEDFYSNCSGTYHFIDEERAIKVKEYLVFSDFFNRFKRGSIHKLFAGKSV